MKPPLRLVLCGHQTDAAIQREIASQLRPLVKQGRVELLSPDELMAGDHQRDGVRAQLRRADAAVLLLSTDFLNHELSALREDLKAMPALHLIPVLVRSCLWEEEEILPHQTLPLGGAALAMLSSARREKALSEMAQQLGAWSRRGEPARWPTQRLVTPRRRPTRGAAVALAGAVLALALGWVATYSFRRVITLSIKDDGRHAALLAGVQRTLEGRRIKNTALNQVRLANLSLATADTVIEIKAGYEWVRCEDLPWKTRSTWLRRSYHGEVVLAGRLRPAGAETYAIDDLRVARFSVVSVSPLAGRFLGFLDMGEMFAQQHYHLTENILRCVNRGECGNDGRENCPP